MMKRRALWAAMAALVGVALFPHYAGAQGCGECYNSEYDGKEVHWFNFAWQGASFGGYYACDSQITSCHTATYYLNCTQHHWGQDRCYLIYEDAHKLEDALAADDTLVALATIIQMGHSIQYDPLAADFKIHSCDGSEIPRRYAAGMDIVMPYLASIDIL